MTSRAWITWECARGHHGSGPNLPRTCPLGWCGETCTAYGDGARRANAGAAR